MLSIWIALQNGLSGVFQLVHAQALALALRRLLSQFGEPDLLF